MLGVGGEMARVVGEDRGGWGVGGGGVAFDGDVASARGETQMNESDWRTQSLFREGVLVRR